MGHEDGGENSVRHRHGFGSYRCHAAGGGHNRTVGVKHVRSPFLGFATLFFWGGFFLGVKLQLPVGPVKSSVPVLRSCTVVQKRSFSLRDFPVRGWVQTSAPIPRFATLPVVSCATPPGARQRGAEAWPLGHG